MNKWLLDKQLCEKLGGCSYMHLWRLRKAGKLPPPKKLNGRNYTEDSEADAAIRAMLEADTTAGGAR